MNDDNFVKLYAYMTRRFDELEAKIDQKADAQLMNERFDAVMKRLDIDESERLAIASQVNRQEVWITKASRKISLPYARS